MIKVITDFPVAFDSPDHLQPHGTANDNSTNIGFIEETIKYFNEQGKDTIKVLDIGCSGGQMIIDYHTRGHVAVGIEGSDYSKKIKRANWQDEYTDKVLFTCDASRPYKIMDGTKRVVFDLITEWENIEHIGPDRLEQYCKNIISHMHENSIFCGSISTKGEEVNGVVLHQSVFNEDTWRGILGNYFDLIEYPFQHKVREDGGSFHIACKKKKIEPKPKKVKRPRISIKKILPAIQAMTEKEYWRLVSKVIKIGVKNFGKKQ